MYTPEEYIREFLEECCLYDPTVPKPTFKGYNRSALDRLRHKLEKEKRGE